MWVCVGSVTRKKRGRMPGIDAFSRHGGVDDSPSCSVGVNACTCLCVCVCVHMNVEISRDTHIIQHMCYIIKCEMLRSQRQRRK